MSNENTGRLVTLTLKEKAIDYTGNITDTGNTKNNSSEDDNYILPVENLITCPLPPPTTTTTTSTSTTTTTTTTLAPSNFNVNFIQLGFSGIAGIIHTKRNNLGFQNELSTLPFFSINPSLAIINRNAFTPIIGSYYLVVEIDTNILISDYDLVITQGGVLGVGSEIGRQRVAAGTAPTISFFAGAEVNYNDIYVQFQIVTTTTTTSTSTSTSTTTTSSTSTTTTTTTISPPNLFINNLSSSDIAFVSLSGLFTNTYPTILAGTNQQFSIPSGSGYSALVKMASGAGANVSINADSGFAPGGGSFSVSDNSLLTNIYITVSDVP